MTKSTITREQLLEIIETDHVQCGEASYLARMALAAMDSEPVAIVEPSDYVTAAQLVGEESLRKAVRELYEGALRIGDKLYRHAQHPVVPASQKEPISFDEWSRKCALQITLCYPYFREKAKYIWDSARETQQPAPVVPEEMTAEQAYEIGDYHGDPVDVFLRGANWMRQHIIDSTLSAAPQSPGSDPATVPGKWIPVSERMPEDEQEVLTINRMGHCFVSFFDKHSGLFFDRIDAPAACCIEHVLVTHWMPLPAAPQEVKDAHH
ncbi:MAG: DUF551 domain-containing protein [Klebsiella pneumoniae]|nr:DUF551 domain-containing protein [Klebsiella pneumoniae]